MFIYVMDEESRDILTSRGFKLLKSNSVGTLWVFENQSDLQFDTLNIPCVVSDILTF